MLVVHKATCFDVQDLATTDSALHSNMARSPWACVADVLEVADYHG